MKIESDSSYTVGYRFKRESKSVSCGSLLVQYYYIMFIVNMVRKVLVKYRYFTQ